MSIIFTNPNQLEEWVEAAGSIQARFGSDKALGYVIGEKFYKLLYLLHDARKIMRTIDEERKNPGFSPIRITRYKDSEIVTNLDETYDDERAKIIEAEQLLEKFVFLISQRFPSSDIRKYFESNPRLGVQRHISTREEHEFLVAHGAVQHSIETEAEDALIFGEMMRYFGITL